MFGKDSGMGVLVADRCCLVDKLPSCYGVNIAAGGSVMLA